jgi:tRNA1(Val) A37 N6-methylase TrmN6
MIVRQMIIHKLILWDIIIEKKRKNQIRNERREDSKLFYTNNKKEIEEKKRNNIYIDPVHDVSTDSVPYDSSTYDQENSVFIELGAGKGLLGLAVSSVKPHSTLG